jgi:hypothetical protein
MNPLLTEHRTADVERPSILRALMPAHDAMLKLVAAQLADDYAGEQHAPRPVPATTPSPNVEPLRGRPELLAIAQNDPGLALKLKWLLDSIQEADWENALAALDHVAFSIRTHRLDSQVDAEGVAKR